VSFLQDIRKLASLEPKCALAIGGLDPITGAGLYSDVKTFSMMKVLPLALATCLVVENSNGVKGVVPFAHELVRLQLKEILEDCTPQTIKIGLVYSSDVVELLAKELPKGSPVVLDPILKSWDGKDLITVEALKLLVELLIPRSTVVTPNILEASVLSGINVRDVDSAKEAARKIADMGAKCVVVKGGHTPSQKAVDVLFYQGEFLVVEKERLFEEPFHGLGCVFAASFAALLAHGMEVPEAFVQASRFVAHAMRGSYKLKGRARIANPLELYYKSLDVVRVIDNMNKALELIESMKGLGELTPEVGVNVVMCLRNPESLEDVCGVEGRLRPVRGFLRAQGQIKFGESRHLGNMLLEVNKKWPSIRACMNVKYSEDLLKALKELGFRISSFDRAKEPLEVKLKEGMSLKWGAQEAIKGLTEEPDAIYDLGDLGKEPMIRVFGRDALDVVRKVELIASKLRELSSSEKASRD